MKTFNLLYSITSTIVVVFFVVAAVVGSVGVYKAIGDALCSVDSNGQACVVGK